MGNSWQCSDRFMDPDNTQMYTRSNRQAAKAVENIEFAGNSLFSLRIITLQVCSKNKGNIHIHSVMSFLVKFLCQKVQLTPFLQRKPKEITKSEISYHQATSSPPGLVWYGIFCTSSNSTIILLDLEKNIAEEEELASLLCGNRSGEAQQLTRLSELPLSEWPGWRKGSSNKHAAEFASRMPLLLDFGGEADSRLSVLGLAKFTSFSQLGCVSCLSLRIFEYSSASLQTCDPAMQITANGKSEPLPEIVVAAWQSWPDLVKAQADGAEACLRNAYLWEKPGLRSPQLEEERNAFGVM
ncbi:hypothetical protein Q9966_005518 [Columba livia]|nr:hypothetical protein Q9966_005518 [Columba livia]